MCSSLEYGLIYAIIALERFSSLVATWDYLALFFIFNVRAWMRFIIKLSEKYWKTSLSVLPCTYITSCNIVCTCNFAISIVGSTYAYINWGSTVLLYISYANEQSFLKWIIISITSMEISRFCWLLRKIKDCWIKAHLAVPMYCSSLI